MKKIYKGIKTFAFAVAAVLLMPAMTKAGATLTSTYMAAGGSAAVTVTNSGPDAVNNVSLQPSGAGVGAQAPVGLGTIEAGGNVFFKLDGVSPSGYIFLDGSGTVVAGQSVSFSVVSKEK